MSSNTCHHCGKSFHYCGSCSGDSASNAGYCSYECLSISKQFKAAKDNAQAFYDSLSDEQRKRFEQYETDSFTFENYSLYKEKK